MIVASLSAPSGADLAVGAGSALGPLGRNRAGKTTSEPKEATA
jgi:ABC-type multidrug transport system ATPase subunit